MNTDIVWGGLLVLGTVCATIQHYITKKSAESEIASLKTRLEFAKQETRIWKTTAYRHADDRNHAIHMAQYWRKQALNEHFGFEPEKAAPSPTVAEVVNEMMRYDALIQAAGWAPANSPAEAPSEGETVTTTKDRTKPKPPHRAPLWAQRRATIVIDFSVDERAFNSRNNPYYNDKGYADPTAYQGIEAAATSEYRARFDAIAALIHTVKYICGLAGFEVVGRITLRHKQSGDIYK
ncbi:hypothetical protein [Gemmiger formicilis]|uniref:hypothetical protein n=1 Tax=Gemmiger formicilis TaxID=745368 RepID=UPI003CCAFF22